MSDHTQVSKKLLTESPAFINIGLDLFLDTLQTQGAEVVNVRWRPPRKSPSDIEAILKHIL